MTRTDIRLKSDSQRLPAIYQDLYYRNSLVKRLWHRAFGHGTDDLLAYKILVSSPSDFYWQVRCELCERTVFRVGVPETTRGTSRPVRLNTWIEPEDPHG